MIGAFVACVVFNTPISKRLGRLLAAKFAAGKITEVDVSELKQMQAHNQVVEIEEPSPPSKKAKTVQSLNSPKIPKKRVKMIMGGSKIFCDSIITIKHH
ncbi:unnamed protein product [Arabidopsis halleri]